MAIFAENETNELVSIDRRAALSLLESESDFRDACDSRQCAVSSVRICRFSLFFLVAIASFAFDGGRADPKQLIALTAFARFSAELASRIKYPDRTFSPVRSFAFPVRSRRIWRINTRSRVRACTSVKLICSYQGPYFANKTIRATTAAARNGNAIKRHPLWDAGGASRALITGH
jgi:hypothetical protein